jgi:hypothetical protein
MTPLFLRTHSSHPLPSQRTNSSIVLALDMIDLFETLLGPNETPIRRSELEHGSAVLLFVHTLLMRSGSYASENLYITRQG